MLGQAIIELTVATRGRRPYEVTDEVAVWVSGQGFQTGLVTLHVRHTSAPLLIQENVDPDVREDLKRFLARLVPDGDPLYGHGAARPLQSAEAGDSKSARLNRRIQGGEIVVLHRVRFPSPRPALFPLEAEDCRAPHWACRW